MNFLVSLLAAGAAVALVIFGARGRLSPFLITIGTAAILIPGYASLADNSHDSGPFYAYAFGVVTLATSYAWAKRVVSPANEPRARMEQPRRGAVVFTIAVVATLSVYHFSQVGLPVLQTNVEISRFDFTASGLFGLPGRVVLFGILIGTYLAVGYASTVKSRIGKPDGILSVAILILIVTRLVMGFKSSLLEVMTTLIVAAVLAWDPPNVRRAAVRLVIPAALAVLFAIAISGQYETVTQSEQSALAYLADRTTVIGAVPGFDVLHGGLVLPSGQQNSLVNDITYYVPKYLGVSPPTNEFPFVSIVSAWIYGTPLTTGSFIVPVTVGAFASLLWDFGFLGFVIYAILGVVFAWAESRALRTTKILPFIAWLTLISGLNGYITKGDLVYNVLNWGSMLAFVTLSYGAGCVLRGRDRRTTANRSKVAPA